MMMEEGTKRKNCKNDFFLSKHCFTPNINGGDLFSIPITNNSNIFLPNSVNHGFGLMCFKFKDIFKYKQHPNLHHSGSNQSGISQQSMSTQRALREQSESNQRALRATK